MKTSTLAMTLLLSGLSAMGAGCGTSAPPMPTIGAQIDRMGRAAVNTALTNPFDIEMGMTSDQVKDAYNADTEVANWTVTWSPKVAKNLAILDSLDGTCGNQFGAGMALSPSRYAVLAGILSDDQIYVNTASEACTTYLGVEANFAGVANADCGGRTPLYDTIQVTYSAAAIGKFAGVTSGVTKDGDGTASVTTFPFLAAPNN